MTSHGLLVRVGECEISRSAILLAGTGMVAEFVECLAPVQIGLWYRRRARNTGGKGLLRLRPVAAMIVNGGTKAVTVDVRECLRRCDCRVRIGSPPRHLVDDREPATLARVAVPVRQILR